MSPREPAEAYTTCAATGAQLIEFTAPILWRALNAASLLTALTRSWQSSNTPRTAILNMFASCSENICAVLQTAQDTLNE